MVFSLLTHITSNKGLDLVLHHLGLPQQAFVDCQSFHLSCARSDEIGLGVTIGANSFK
jgi:hypothetical protein